MDLTSLLPCVRRRAGLTCKPRRTSIKGWLGVGMGDCDPPERQRACDTIIVKGEVLDLKTDSPGAHWWRLF